MRLAGGTVFININVPDVHSAFSAWTVRREEKLCSVESNVRMHGFVTRNIYVFIQLITFKESAVLHFGHVNKSLVAVIIAPTCKEHNFTHRNNSGTFVQATVNRPSEICRF